MSLCSICGNNKNFITVHSYTKPDKYEKWVGLKDIKRSWVRCSKCGFYIQIRNYDINDLERIYSHGYRDKGFRGETIKEAFDRIVNVKHSENEQRFLRFALNSDYEECKKVLDIGSGIGVWPALLKRAEYEVDCVEENQFSIDFIYEYLGLKCFRGVDIVYDKYDVVTLIHVLEHIKDPVSFLKNLKKNIRGGGRIFIEVPDSFEFTYLDKDHDEFNSCHVHFYNIGSLYKVIEYAGYTPVDMHIEKTKERNLTRVMCTAIN